MGFTKSLFGGDSGNTGGAGLNYQASGPTQEQSAGVWNNTQNALAQQQSLAGSLQAMAAGAGPNPAQQQFQQNANQLAAQTAGAIGSTKGISPALQARLIAQQSANVGQNVAGQNAEMQQQQQLNGINALQNNYNAYQQGALGQQSNVLGLQGNSNTANAGVSSVAAGQQGKLFGGLLNGAGAAMGMAHGGMVPQHFAGGGPVDAGIPQAQSSFSRMMLSGSMANAQGKTGDPLEDGASNFGQGLGKLIKGGGDSPMGAMAGGAGDAAPAGIADAAPLMMAANKGEMVPGKANKRGDSLKNDVVPTMLSPGEVVIPRSVMNSKDPAAGASKFVAAIMAKQRLKK